MATIVGSSGGDGDGDERDTGLEGDIHFTLNSTLTPGPPARSSVWCISKYLTSAESLEGVQDEQGGLVTSRSVPVPADHVRLVPLYMFSLLFFLLLFFYFLPFLIEMVRREVETYWNAEGLVKGAHRLYKSIEGLEDVLADHHLELSFWGCYCVSLNREEINNNY